jgi:divalent metal cation (Fe/Co/Zn/Cd) transporter
MIGVKAVAPRAERFKRIARVLWITLVLNWLTASLKVILGFATQCMVIVADGLHSFSDGSSNIAGLAAIRAASAPPDEDHP